MVGVEEESTSVGVGVDKTDDKTDEIDRMNEMSRRSVGVPVPRMPVLSARKASPRYARYGKMQGLARLQEGVDPRSWFRGVGRL